MARVRLSAFGHRENLASRLLQVQVMRQPSMKFDNKSAGTAWIDELRLEPISLHSPR